MQNEKYIVGLTGGIGSGKSTVAKMLQDESFIVIDADEVSRDIVEPDSMALKKIVDVFGDSVLTDSGELDRRTTAQIVFNNPEKRRTLEKILHPIIIDRIWHFVEKTDEKTVIIMAPLLFEAEMDKKCDMVVLITASQDISIERVVDRDNVSASEVKNRIEAQMPEAVKIAKADYIIDNNGSLSELKFKVKQLSEIIRKNAVSMER